MKHVYLNGLFYRICKIFRSEQVNECNRHLEQNKDESVLCEKKGFVYVVKTNDLGVKDIGMTTNH